MLTTHTGSLPRPPELAELLIANERGQADQVALAARTRQAVEAVVRKQAEVGITVVNDGEMGKIGYSTYVKHRLTGFEGEVTAVGPTDVQDFPAFAERMWSDLGVTEDTLSSPSCSADIQVRDREQLRRDIDNLGEAVRGTAVEDVFMTAASPGVIALFFGNQHYATREEYVHAIAAAMREEYEAITQAGFVLQLDCPDLAMGRHIQFGDSDLDSFLREARVNVEAVNEATRNIDPDQMRMHLCWGNYEGPHHKDVALRSILDVVFAARPNGISYEACNPRHDHEWHIFETIKLPADKVLIPGVVDSTTNYIEHPDLVAERIVRLARLVGMENVIGGSDCGFGTFAGVSNVNPDISWAKLRSLAEGAELATRALLAPH